MINRNIDRLEINKMTQAQYDRELAAGNIKDGVLYLTPCDESEYATIQYVDSIEEDFTGTLTTTWLGDTAPFTQEVNVVGILATDKPIIDLIASDTFATAETENTDWCKIYKAVTSANTITFYASEAPTVAMNFSCKVVR